MGKQSIQWLHLNKSTRAMIAQLQAFESIVFPNSAKAFLCFSDPLPTLSLSWDHYLPNFLFSPPNVPCSSHHPLKLSVPSIIPCLEMSLSQPPPWQVDGPCHMFQQLLHGSRPPLLQMKISTLPRWSTNMPWSKRGLQICPSSVEFTSVRNVNTEVKSKCE